jgi:hypothetical protein
MENLWNMDNSILNGSMPTPLPLLRSASIFIFVALGFCSCRPTRPIPLTPANSASSISVTPFGDTSANGAAWRFSNVGGLLFLEYDNNAVHNGHTAYWPQLPRCWQRIIDEAAIADKHDSPTLFLKGVDSQAQRNRLFFNMDAVNVPVHESRLTTHVHVWRFSGGDGQDVDNAHGETTCSAGSYMESQP